MNATTTKMTYAEATMLNAAMRLTQGWKCCWYDNADVVRILTDAAKKGYVKRLSHTQIQWTPEGVAAYDAAIGD